MRADRAIECLADALRTTEAPGGNIQSWGMAVKRSRFSRLDRLVAVSKLGARGAVQLFAEDVGVAVVAGVFSDEVGVDPAEGYLAAGGVGDLVVEG